jgi:glutaredoxin
VCFLPPLGDRGYAEGRHAASGPRAASETARPDPSGCNNCVNTAKLVEDTAHALGSAVMVEKVTDKAAILGFGVISTPSVVVDGKVVHSGGIPKREAIESWLNA